MGYGSPTVPEEDFPALPNGPTLVRGMIVNILGPRTCLGPQQEPRPQNKSGDPDDSHEASMKVEFQNFA